MNSKDEFIRTMKQKMDGLNSEIDKLTAMGGKVSADLKNEYHEQIGSLKARQTAVREKLQELQHAGEDAWGDLKSGVDLALAALGKALDSARTQFR
jgi:uncharacterized coiled-coil DUF342 family protein